MWDPVSVPPSHLYIISLAHGCLLRCRGRLHVGEFLLVGLGRGRLLHLLACRIQAHIHLRRHLRQLLRSLGNRDGVRWADDLERGRQVLLDALELPRDNNENNNENDENDYRGSVAVVSRLGESSSQQKCAADVSNEQQAE